MQFALAGRRLTCEGDRRPTFALSGRPRDVKTEDFRAG